MIDTVEIFTDGGARGNPGPAGIGVFIKEKNGKTLAEIGESIGVATNNVAEYKAVVRAFLWLLEHEKKIAKTATVNFFLDSQLVCFQLTGVYKVRNQDLAVLLLAIKDKEKRLQRIVSYAHIPREKNKNADSLVNMALDKQI